MCLLTNRKEPYIAKRDIVVYKSLLKEYDDSSYITPYQRKIVRLNHDLVPEENDVYDDFSRKPTTSVVGVCQITENYMDVDPKWMIGGGAIHAYMSPIHTTCFKAVIPKGTKFWISHDGIEICARKLFVTDQEIPFKYVHTIKPDKIIKRIVEKNDRLDRIRIFFKKIVRLTWKTN